jgi:hypothetical protein
VVLGQLKEHETVLEQVETTLGKLNYESTIGQVLPQPVKDVIVGMGDALKLLLKSQKNITSVLVDVVKVNEVGSSAPQHKISGEVKTKAKQPPPPPVDPTVAAQRKVKQALRDSEKKTLLFNLDMGKVPTMNKDTLSRKVTLALGEKASSGNHDYDIKDAEDAIDDILSCSRLEFLGVTSKKFFNKKNVNDARNDTFCTLPVRFEFKDKETRIQAEKTLCKVCKVSCAVPYPKKLRLLLDSMINEGKKNFPNSFIRTKVDVDNLTIEAHAKTGEGWIDLGLKRDIPLTICDTTGNDLPVVTVASQSEVMIVS